MENTMVVKIEPQIDGLTVRSLRVMKRIEKELGDRTDRVDYGLIAEELGIEWNNVKYDVQKLAKAGVLDVSNGRMKVLKRIVV